MLMVLLGEAQFRLASVHGLPKPRAKEARQLPLTGHRTSVDKERADMVSNAFRQLPLTGRSQCSNRRQMRKVSNAFRQLPLTGQAVFILLDGSGSMKSQMPFGNYRSPDWFTSGCELSTHAVSNAFRQLPLTGPHHESTRFRQSHVSNAFRQLPLTGRYSLPLQLKVNRSQMPFGNYRSPDKFLIIDGVSQELGLKCLSAITAHRTR